MLGGRSRRRSTLLWRLKVRSELRKGKREIVAVRLGSVFLMKGICQHSCGQNIAAYFMFASGHSLLPPTNFYSVFPFLFFCPVSFRWKDQIRSSVKIARQRFACQGISFCYLYWNIIRFTLSPFAHLTLPLPLPLLLHFHFHLNFHFTEAMLEIDSDSDSFSIRFVSIQIDFDSIFGAWQNSTYLCQLQFYVSC